MVAPLQPRPALLTGKMTAEQAARLRNTTTQGPPHATKSPAPRHPPPPPPSAPKDPPPPPPPPPPAKPAPAKTPPPMTTPPAEGRKSPRKHCGRRLDFNPSERAIKCPYCGYVEPIAPAQTQFSEHDYA